MKFVILKINEVKLFTSFAIENKVNDLMCMVQKFQ